MHLVFFHGLDSSPLGTKSRLLKRHYPDCLIPDLPPDLDQRLKIVEQQITSPMLIIGSSLGGSTALMYADRHPEMAAAMVLMAPAVGFSDQSLFTPEQVKKLESVYVPAGIPSIIIAGRQDEAIPIDAIEDMINRSPEPRVIEFHAVDDDHNLHQSLDLMLQSIEKLRTTRTI